MLKHRHVAMPRDGACDESTDGRTDGLTEKALSRRMKKFSYVTHGRACGHLQVVTAAVTLALAVSGCAATATTAAPHTIAPSSTTPSTNTPAASPAPSPWPTPDNHLTPGAIATTTPDRICPHVDRKLEAARPSSADKARVYRAYHLDYPQPTGKYELDHLIPIELGGAPNDPANEWPEPNTTVDPAAIKRWGFSPAFIHNPKDLLEAVLHREVCDGRVPLGEAQQAIASDWPAAYAHYVAEGL